MLPVVREIDKRSGMTGLVAVTGQHREMLDQILGPFDIHCDYDLNVMTGRQSLDAVASRVIERMTPVLQAAQPDVVLVQGDTTSALSACISAVYARVPVGHIEAGLRTGDKWSPFPEEMNRRAVSSLADYHFAPTSLAKMNLIRNGVSETDIWVTGNTVIDALHMGISMGAHVDPLVASRVNPGTKMILVTMHRRENLGRRLRDVMRAIRRVAQDRADVLFVYPMHKNPAVRSDVLDLLGDEPRVLLIESQEYLPFVQLMKSCSFIVTDSGGIQEEAPSLDKPVLCVREDSERMEAVEVGAVQLVGTATDDVQRAICRLLDDEAYYASMACVPNPFGDGSAARRIVDALSGMPELRR